jgi:TRAP-type uncharacterized transport system fused permease subunit
MGLPAFIVPYIFVYNPALLLMGKPFFLLQAIITAIIGMYLLAGAVIGYHLRNVNFLERLFLAASAIALLVPEIKTDIIGLVVAALMIVIQKAFPYWTLFRKKPKLELDHHRSKKDN